MAKTVADVMTPEPFTVGPDTVLKEAIQIMADNHVGGLPVVDDAGKLVGILSESDLMWQTTGVELPAYTDKVVAIAPDKSLKSAAQLMHDKRIRRLPVVDDEGKVIGVLTRGDIVREMANTY